MRFWPNPNPTPDLHEFSEILVSSSKGEKNNKNNKIKVSWAREQIKWLCLFSDLKRKAFGFC